MLIIKPTFTLTKNGSILYTSMDEVRQKLDVIARNPYANLPYVKRLKNSQNYRFRFGDYRGVYNLADKILTITVIDVAHRKDIYRR